MTAPAMTPEQLADDLHTNLCVGPHKAGFVCDDHDTLREALRQLAAAEYARGREEHDHDPGACLRCQEMRMAGVVDGQALGREECEKGHPRPGEDVRYAAAQHYAAIRDPVRRGELVGAVCVGHARCAATHAALEAEAERRGYRLAELNQEMGEGIIAEIRELIDTMPCCHQPGPHPSTPPMFFREALLCIIKHAQDTLPAAPPTPAPGGSKEGA